VFNSTSNLIGVVTYITYTTRQEVFFLQKNNSTKDLARFIITEEFLHTLFFENEEQLGEKITRQCFSAEVKTTGKNSANLEQKKTNQNCHLSAVVIATILAPVSICQKTKYPHLQPLK